MDNQIVALFIIASYKQRDTLEKLFEKNNLPLTLAFHGKGTAVSEILDYLGLEDTKRLIVLSFIREDKIPLVYDLLNKVLNLDNKGTGIAFAINLSSASGALSKIIDKYDDGIDNKFKLDYIREEYHMTKDYELILTIVSSGYLEQVMEAAKSVGAKGGTVIHAKGLGYEEAVKFLGITIQPEKDIVLILSTKSKKNNIMEAINKKAGLSTPGKGICFSLPVSSTFGLNADINLLK